MRSRPTAVERIWHGHLPGPAAVFGLSSVRRVRAVGTSADRPAAGGRVATCRMRVAISAPLIETSAAHRCAVPANEGDGAGAGAWPSWCRWSISSSSFFSTLRLDFWLRPSPALSPRRELFAMAMFYRPAQFAGDPAPDVAFHLVRGLVILVCGMLAGAVGMQLRRQFEASILAATARDRITNLFGQHVSPQVVGAADGRGRRAPTSDIRRGRRHVRRFPQFHRRRALAFAAGGGRPARRCVRGAGRYPRPPWRHREQVSGRRISGAVRRAASRRPMPRTARSHAAREMLDANERVNQATSAGRCASASAFISARWSPAISARRGARNTP